MLKHTTDLIEQSRDAQLLELPANALILLAESINIDQIARRIEYGVSRYRGESSMRLTVSIR
ncbi:MAG: UTRA domain-containing protein [Chroococcidiopsidaceae cyanobacterium CP_BM_ER_R8_30]|nr:UTRA domain-containing protein [Chroococcidiopsidaceae cyanobacterium CP_BM_ER_R8_30]